MIVDSSILSPEPRAVAGATLCDSPDRPALIRWLDRTLRPQGEISVRSDLPLLLSGAASTLTRTMMVDGAFASHAAAFLTHARIAGSRIPIALIGAVATDPAQRRFGLARRVLDALEADLVARGVPLALLWSDVEGFYERRGFVRSGAELVSVCPRITPRPRRGTVVRPFRNQDLSAIRALHDMEDSRIERTSATWRALTSLPRTDIYVVVSGKSVVAYGVVGKGHDLAGCLHEWGGSDQWLSTLIGGIFRLRLEPELYVMSPPWKTRARKSLEAVGAEGSIGALGMIKVLCRDRLCGLLGLAKEALPSNGTALALELFGDPASAGGACGRIPLYAFGLDSM